jgi:hypothetical protein
MSIIAESLGQSSLFVASGALNPKNIIPSIPRFKSPIPGPKRFGFNKYTLSNKNFDFRPLQMNSAGNDDLVLEIDENIEKQY